MSFSSLFLCGSREAHALIECHFAKERKKGRVIESPFSLSLTYCAHIVFAKES